MIRQLPMPQEAAFKVIRPQVAAQLEPMLHLAYRLGLDELRDKLHNFVLTNTMFRSSLLTRGMLTSSVFTERVMAAIDRRRLRDAWIDHIINEAGDASRDGGLFEMGPGSGSVAEGAVSAEVTLRRSFMGRCERKRCTVGPAGGSGVPYGCVLSTFWLRGPYTTPCCLCCKS